MSKDPDGWSDATRFLDRYEAACASFTPLMRLLCRAVGVPYWRA